jgi:hypothetical protein
MRYRHGATLCSCVSLCVVMVTVQRVTESVLHTDLCVCCIVLTSIPHYSIRTSSVCVGVCVLVVYFA